MPLNLDTLPVELVSSLLEVSHTPQDLLNLISASPHCYRVFAATPTRFLRSTLQSAVPNALLDEFSAAFFTVTKFHHDLDEELISEDKANVIAYMERYFNSSPNFELPTSYDDLKLAFKFHHRVLFFITDFARKAASELHVLTQIEHPAAHQRLDEMPPLPFHISDSETLRLYRAFLRFEIYSRLFRPVVNFTGPQQLALFLQNFQPWEAEELTCVHQYLMTIVQGALDKMDQDFEASARRLIVTEPPADSPLATSAKADNSRPGVQREMANFSGMSLGRLRPFSQDFRDHSTVHMSAWVSQGLFYMFGFARASKEARFGLLRRDDPFLHQFLINALRGGTNTGALPTNTEVQNSDDPMQANLGYTKYKAQADAGYLGIRNCDGNIPFRALGYLFWDSARINSPQLQLAFTRVCNMSLDYIQKRYKRESGISPETSLGEARLLRKHMTELLEKFGLLEDDFDL